MKHVNIRVIGKVQGVFFRASTKQKADELGVHGFVKNERDGSVYIESEGDEEPLISFVEWCRLGPTYARVESCEVTESGIMHFKGFEIRR